MISNDLYKQTLQILATPRAAQRKCNCKIENLWLLSQNCANNSNIYWENSSENATNGLVGLCANAVWSWF